MNTPDMCAATLRTEQDRALSAVRVLAEYVNNMGHNPKDFVEQVSHEHRTLQQQMFQLMCNCISAWADAYTDGNYDGRNEFACKKSKEIVELVPYFRSDCTRVPLI